MVTINRLWWEHLAPKVMFRRLHEIEGLLRTWCRTEYGAHWLRVATQDGGVMRVAPGQIIPAVHFVALAGKPVFVAPQAVVREGHRMVGPNTFRSDKPLGPGELAIAPEIRVDVVQDPQMLAAAARGDTSAYAGRVTVPSLVFSAPAACLLTPRVWPKTSYVLYQHIFGDGRSYPNDGYFYVGVSTRSWQARWAEHRRAVGRDSPLLFHRKLRDETAAGRVTYIHHKVMAITGDLDALYGAEEFLVREHWEDNRRLNMIPGGKSGLKYLREHGLLVNKHGIRALTHF